MEVSKSLADVYVISKRKVQVRGGREGGGGSALKLQRWCRPFWVQEAQSCIVTPGWNACQVTCDCPRPSPNPNPNPNLITDPKAKGSVVNSAIITLTKGFGQGLPLIKADHVISSVRYGLV